MTLVASYVFISPYSYRPSLRVGLPTTIDLYAANVHDEVAAVEAITVFDTVFKTREGTSLASTTDAVNTGIFETNTTGQTVLAHNVRTLVTQTKNQPLMTNCQHQHLHYQAFTQHGATVLSSSSHSTPYFLGVDFILRKYPCAGTGRMTKYKSSPIKRIVNVIIFVM